MDKTFVMLGKGVDTFKRDMAVTPLRPIHGGKSIPESLDSFAQVKSWNRKLACLT